MKVLGEKLSVVNQKVLTLNRKSADGKEQAISLTVSPPQLAYKQKYGATGVLEYPKIPVELVRDKKTGKVEVDENGEIVKVQNTNDPAFVRKWNNANNRTSAIQFRDVLRFDQTVEFETEQPSFERDEKNESEDEWKKRWKKYGDDLYAELGAAGFTDGEIDKVLEVASELEVSTNEDKVISDFS